MSGVAFEQRISWGPRLSIAIEHTLALCWETKVEVVVERKPSPYPQQTMKIEAHGMTRTKLLEPPPSSHWGVRRRLRVSRQEQEQSSHGLCELLLLSLYPPRYLEALSIRVRRSVGATRVMKLKSTQRHSTRMRHSVSNGVLMCLCGFAI